MPDLGPMAGFISALKGATKSESASEKPAVLMPPKPDTIPVGMLRAFEDFNSTEVADSTRLKAFEAMVRMVMDKLSEDE